MPQLLQKWRPTVLPILERQGPAVWKMPIPSNKSQAEDMQCLEMDATEEKRRDHLSFLVACGTTLQACPSEAHGVLFGPLQLLMVNIPLATLLNIPQVCSTRQKSASMVPLPQLQQHLGPLLGPNDGTLNPTMQCPCHGQEAQLWGLLKSHPTLRQKDEMPFRKSLKRSQEEAFAKD